MKKIAAFFAALFLALSSLTGFAFAKPIELMYDGVLHKYTGDIYTLKIDNMSVNTDVPPVIINDRTLVPARAVFEKVGAAVGWDEASQKVTVSLNGVNMVLKINDKKAEINGKAVSLDVPAKIINNRTMLPLRFVGEHLNMKVGWIPEKGLVTLDHTNTQPQTQVIKDIKFESSPEMDTVTIPLDNPVSCSSFYLASPERVVVDISGISAPLSQQVINVNGKYIKSIRYALQSGSKSRVVLDLTRQAEYRITASDNQILLEVSLPAGTDDTASRGDYDRGEETNPPQTPPTGEDQPSQPSPSDGSVIPGDPGVEQDGDAGTPADLPEKLVVIDAGHGGSDSGAKYGDLSEKDLNLDIAQRVNDLLQGKKIKTVMTRTDDTYIELYDRAGTANDLKASLFLSIHINANDRQTMGTETLYYPYSDTSGFNGMSFARIIQDKLLSALGTVDRGLVARPNLVVLRETKMPSAIAEVAFIDNKEDRENLIKEEFRQKAAEALSDAVVEALGEID